MVAGHTAATGVSAWGSGGTSLGSSPPPPPLLPPAPASGQKDIDKIEDKRSTPGHKERR